MLQLLTLQIQDVIEILDIPEVETVQNDVLEEDDVLQENEVEENFGIAMPIQAIINTNSESPIPDQGKGKQAAIIASLPPIFPTSDSTSEPTTNTSTENVQITFPIQQVEQRRASNPGVPEDAPAMSTRSRTRRQAYAAALQTTDDLAPFHAAFAVSLEKSSTPSTVRRMHRDSMPSEPKHWREMFRHPFAKDFMTAAVKEAGDLSKREIYELVNEGKQKRIPLTWVFKYKFDIDGFITKFKARLCVRGDLQTISEETYAATLAARTFRFLMAITAVFDMDIHQYDAVLAFLNNDLDEEIHCELSNEFKIPGKLWRLRKALYGLKQTPIL